MRKALVFSIIFTISSLAFGADSNSSSTSNSSREGFSDRYGILSDKNIFVRDRRSRSRRDESSGATTRTSRPVEESLVLTGIVLEDEGFRAYVEDMNGRSTLRLGPGDSVAHGKVAAIGLDSMDYESNGQRKTIFVGSDLTGNAVSLGSSSSESSAGSSESASAATQPSGAPIDPNDPNLSAEQRMKLRRQQELKH